MKKVMVGYVDLVKMLYFLLLTLIVGLLYGLTWIRSDMHGYRMADVRLQEARRQHQQATALESLKNQTLERLKKEKRAILSALGNHFDTERFKRTHQNELTFTRLVETNTTIDDGFVLRHYEAVAYFSSPSIFFTFVKNLEHGEYVVGLGEKLEISSSQGGLQAIMELIVYERLNEINKTAISTGGHTMIPVTPIESNHSSDAKAQSTTSHAGESSHK
ncbi:MAG: hypothetical protein K6347_07415 [Campylobacterales bacterium]